MVPLVGMHFTLFFLISVASCVSLSLLAVYGTRHLDVPGIPAFIGCMLIGSFWAIMQGLEFMGTSLNTKLIFANLQYLAGPFAPVTWFFMVMYFTGRENLVTKKLILLLTVIPAATAVLVWLDPMLGLVRTDFKLIIQEPFSVIKKTYGPWFWLHFAHCSIVNLLSVILLTVTIIRNKKAYRMQAALLLLGLCLIGITNILYITGISPVKSFDLTPVVFTFSAFVTTLGIVKYKLFDLVPVTRDFIFDSMDIGIITTDSEMRIIDINDTAVNMLSLKGRKVMGRPISSFADTLAAGTSSMQSQIAGSISKNETQNNHLFKQITVMKDDHATVLEIKASHLKGSHKNRSCWIFMLNEVTEMEAAKQQILDQQKKLAVSEEQQRVARDLHDNIGQIISFTKIQLQTIEREIKNARTDIAENHISRLKQITDQAHEQLREYVFNLRSGTESNKTFSELIKELVFGNFHNSGIDFEIDIKPETEDFFGGIDKKIHLTSLTKEAINNSLKYSGGQKITIRADRLGGKIYYHISDDGRGIPEEVLRNPDIQTSGLRIMAERAMLTRGEIQISASENSGTAITICYDEE